MSDSKVFSTKNVARIAVFSAFATVLYAFVTFSLPFMFPEFLKFQISEMPALLAGYMMGPVSGCLVILVKTLLKLLIVGTSTSGVGELGDFLFGITFVIVSSLVYRRHRSKKGALVSLVIGSLSCTVVALFVNAFILVPFYAVTVPGGLDSVAGMLKPLFPGVNKENLMLYYLPLSVAPFNLLRCIVSSAITFLIYKKLSRFFDIMFEPQENYLIIGGKKCILNHVVTRSEKATYNLGVKIGKKLVGGEIITLSGDLGAGKTVLSRGIAAGLGITEGVVSPTFTHLNCYEGRLKLYHYDAYRLSGAEEAEEMGLTEYFGAEDGVCVIEWPENIEGAIQGDVIAINIKYADDNKREVSVVNK